MHAFRRYRTFSLALACTLLLGVSAPFVVHVCAAEQALATQAMDCCPKSGHPADRADMPAPGAPASDDGDASDRCCRFTVVQAAELPAVAPDPLPLTHLTPRIVASVPTPEPAFRPVDGPIDTGPPAAPPPRAHLSVWLI